MAQLWRLRQGEIEGAAGIDSLTLCEIGKINDGGLQDLRLIIANQAKKWYDFRPGRRK